MAVTGEGSAKLLLFGEHAAVYGYPALGLGLPWKTQVIIDESPDSQAWALPSLHHEESARLHALVSLMFETFPLLRREGYSLTINSDVPKGMGFGSSAALCVALVKAVVTILANRFLPASWARELLRELGKLWALANKAERLFHGKPSGIDTGLALFGKMQGFSFAGKLDGLPSHAEIKSNQLTLIVGGVPRDGSTKGHVQSIDERFKHNDLITKTGIARLGEISSQAITCFHRGEQSNGDDCSLSYAMGNLADMAEDEICKLGLGNIFVHEILACGRSAGATGGKTSGAGGGGAFYLVAPSDESGTKIYQSVRQKMNSMGLESSPLMIMYKSGGVETSGRGNSEGH